MSRPVLGLLLLQVPPATHHPPPPLPPHPLIHLVFYCSAPTHQSTNIHPALQTDSFKFPNPPPPPPLYGVFSGKRAPFCKNCNSKLVFLTADPYLCIQQYGICDGCNAEHFYSRDHEGYHCNVCPLDNNCDLCYNCYDDEYEARNGIIAVPQVTPLDAALYMNPCFFHVCFFFISLFRLLLICFLLPSSSFSSFPLLLLLLLLLPCPSSSPRHRCLCRYP